VSEDTLYRIADISFFVFHVALIFFNLFGWLFRPLRRWNLITLGLTAFSWLVLGLFYGLGYCFLTDWHWAVRDKLGYETPYSSYIHFLVEMVFKVRVSPTLVDTLTAVCFGLAVVASAIVNIRSPKRKS